MKKFLYIALLINSSIYAQFSFADKIDSNLSFQFDPYASIKEEGLNIGMEFNANHKGIYLHTGIQSFSKLEGDYFDWTTGAGAAFQIDQIPDLKPYLGFREGFINRAGNIYITFGTEAGLDYSIGSFVIGIVYTWDFRSDFDYWGGEAEMRPSTMGKIGIKL